MVIKPEVSMEERFVEEAREVYGSDDRSQQQCPPHNVTGVCVFLTVVHEVTVGIIGNANVIKRGRGELHSRATRS